jgi:hypothetical protein
LDMISRSVQLQIFQFISVYKELKVCQR